MSATLSALIDSPAAFLLTGALFAALLHPRVCDRLMSTARKERKP